MFGGGPFGDPFFGDVHRQMHRQMAEMDSMMGGLMDPFGFPRPRGMAELMLEDGSGRRGRSVDARGGERSLAHHRPRDPFDELLGFGGGGLLGGGMLRGMLGGGGLGGGLERMRERALNDPNSHVYTTSTVVSFGPQGPDGQPQVYQTTDEVRKAGDVRETRRSVRDSTKGEERMEIGHQIGERAHIIEKRRGRDGTIREAQRFRGLSQRDAQAFDREFEGRARRNLGGYGASSTAPAQPPLARLQYSPGQRRRTSAQSQGQGPIITEVDDEAPGAPPQDEPKRRRPSANSSASTFRPASFPSHRHPPSHTAPANASPNNYGPLSGPVIEEVE